jgi:hypothetical protein
MKGSHVGPWVQEDSLDKFPFSPPECDPVSICLTRWFQLVVAGFVDVSTPMLWTEESHSTLRYVVGIWDDEFVDLALNILQNP